MKSRQAVSAALLFLILLSRPEPPAPAQKIHRQLCGRKLGPLQLPAISAKITRYRTLSSGKTEVKQSADGITLTLPAGTNYVLVSGWDPTAFEYTLKASIVP